MTLRTLAILLLSLIGTTGIVHAQETRPRSTPLAITAASYLALAGWDAQQTASCLRQGRCRETNPLLTPMASRPRLLAATKMGTSSAFVWTVWRLHRAHPKAAWGLLLGAVTLQAVVDVHNAQTLARVRQ